MVCKYLILICFMVVFWISFRIVYNFERKERGSTCMDKNLIRNPPTKWKRKQTKMAQGKDAMKWYVYI